MPKRQVLTLEDLMDPDSIAVDISNKFVEWDSYRRGWANQTAEVREYIFATDTQSTSNGQLDWKNKTHIPKLCQIRDNLHANYMAALFPNDRAVRWEGDDRSSATKQKRSAVESYINNKMRLGNFVPEIEKCIYDWIDYGNAFALVEYVDESTTDSLTGETIQGFVGPKLRRINPLDIVFNPLASSFSETPKVIRSLMTLGGLKKEISTNPEKGYLEEVFKKALQNRHQFANTADSDVRSTSEFQIQGFGSYLHYLQSDYVEVLDFYGDLYDEKTGELLENYVVTVIDRAFVIRKEPNPSWLGHQSIHHVGWRIQQNNLYAMGPLENLIGMQYRINHLENAKADGIDMILHPVLKVRGLVEEFDYGPNERIYVGDDGDVDFMHPDATLLNADTQIALYEQKMEEMAGAPKQAMGFRTPGEKTAFEVQVLENGANKVFLNKTSYFERVFLEPLMNTMLEVGRRLIGPSEQLKTVDEDFNVVSFKTITKEDITAKGKLRPIGARHFARNANMLQNLVQLANSPLGQDPKVQAHISGKGLARLIEELLDLERFDLVRENVAIAEQSETQQLALVASQNLQAMQQGATDANQMAVPPQG